MKKNILYILVASIVIVFILIKCKGDPKTSSPKHIKTQIPIEIISPANSTDFNLGDVVSFEIKVNKPEEIKNLNLYINDTIFASNLKVESQVINVPTKNGKVGWVDFYLDYKDLKGKSHRDYRKLVFFSDEKPKELFAIVKSDYTHNTSSYTQGLEFYKGKLYESTGRKGFSKIAEVSLLNGETLKSKSLEDNYFGEGLTILNDTIYQITWQSQVCFLYDMDFNKIGELPYEGEGWGLTNNGKSIIMTNGSSEIVWRNPKTFEIEKRIYAFENESDVVQLNELELINGKLYINVYQANRIVEVDTFSGKVNSSIICNDLVVNGRDYNSDVLNGIAYNEETDKIYMTGKLWPKLFEVKFEE